MIRRAPDSAAYDEPADLPERLVAAGFVPEPTEALLVGEIAALRLDVPPPPGIELRAVIDTRGVEALVSVHSEVFGGDQSTWRSNLLADLAHGPAPTAGVVALAGSTPIAAGRVEFHTGTEFASLLGGATLPAWVGRFSSASALRRSAPRLRSSTGLEPARGDQ